MQDSDDMRFRYDDAPEIIVQLRRHFAYSQLNPKIPLPSLPQEIVFYIMRLAFENETAAAEAAAAEVEDEFEYSIRHRNRWTAFTGVCRLFYHEFAPLIWETLNVRDALSADFLKRTLEFYDKEGNASSSVWLKCPLRFSKRVRFPSHEPDGDLAEVLSAHKHNITTLEWYSGVYLPSRALRIALAPSATALHIEWRAANPYALVGFEEWPRLEELRVSLKNGNRALLHGHNDDPDWISYTINSRRSKVPGGSVADLMSEIELEERGHRALQQGSELEALEAVEAARSDASTERPDGYHANSEHEGGDHDMETDYDDDGEDYDAEYTRPAYVTYLQPVLDRQEEHERYKGVFGRPNFFYPPHVSEGLKRLTLSGYGYCALFAASTGTSGVASRLEELDLTPIAFDRGVPFALLSARKTLKRLTLRSYEPLQRCNHGDNSEAHLAGGDYSGHGLAVQLDCQWFALERCLRLMTGRMKALEHFHLDIGGSLPESAYEFATSCPRLASGP